jgi:hypothetical protein
MDGRSFPPGRTATTSRAPKKLISKEAFDASKRKPEGEGFLRCVAFR